MVCGFQGKEYAIIAAGLLMIYRRLGGGRLTASISLPSISLPDNITAIGSEAFDSEMRIEAGFKTKTALALAASEIAYWDGQLQYQGTALCNCAREAIAPSAARCSLHRRRCPRARI